jgi:hypothetical protein
MFRRCRNAAREDSTGNCGMLARIRAILFLAAFADLLTCERSSKVILTMSERLTLA